ncbi:DUF1737 domain-containing protein [Pseudomonas aeruginosa]|nr:DUF1737 domain-containing protein [Pseudomonas aeruginosa]EMB2838879.1 hypothetical protein [Pseudomonas aeruginosa]MBF8391141.1 hypothetical protein [Pseudomonas aeruginosa]MBG5198273.1 hypothetical protein [Pseudomonas aeruginosa]MBG7447237.1 hypothetical protein [Pseudomonas aeruginosa]MCD2742761.1 DUF1737 domain-containing protein [Pseudomonas aeruginosa]
MAYTAYRVLKAPIDQIERFMTEAIADGWQPLGAVWRSSQRRRGRQRFRA